MCNTHTTRPQVWACADFIAHPADELWWSEDEERRSMGKAERVPVNDACSRNPGHNATAAPDTQVVRLL